MLPYDGFDEEMPPSVTINEADHPEKLWIAELSSQDIAQMSDRELTWAIRDSQLPLDGHVGEDLGYYGRETLERLMFLAREMCRHQCPKKPR
jgi:hypothetical protein